MKEKKSSRGGARPGAGRPKVGDRRWSFRVSEEEYRQLLSNALKAGISAGEYVRTRCCQSE